MSKNLSTELDTPDVIESKIEKLQKQLIKSKKKYHYKFLCDDKFSDDMIGFFNLGNARKILELLNNGKKLQYRHGIYGDVDVEMNPQRNVIMVNPIDNEHINENNIMDFIVWHTGTWYVFDES